MAPRTPRGFLRHTLVAAISMAVAVTVSALLAPAPAHADPSAAQLADQVEAQGRALGVIVEQYNTVNVLLDRTRAQQADVQAKLPALTAQVDSAATSVDAVVAQAYKGSTASGFEALLSAGTPADLVERMTTLGALSRSQQQDLATLRAAQDKLETEKTRLATLASQQSAQQADLARRKADIETKIGALKKQQDDLARRQAEQARAAAAAAAAAHRPPATGGGTPAPPPPPVTSGRVAQVIAYAYAQLGKPYVFGAAGPRAFDCSGLVMMAWAQAGVHLAHSSYIQMNEQTVHIPRGALRPGDLVFFEGGGHVGLYIGNGNVIQAPHTGDVVKISSIDWIGHYTVAGRVRG